MSSKSLAKRIMYRVSGMTDLADRLQRFLQQTSADDPRRQRIDELLERARARQKAAQR